MHKFLACVCIVAACVVSTSHFASTHDFRKGANVRGLLVAPMPSNISCDLHDEDSCPLPMRCDVYTEVCVCCESGGNSTSPSTIFCRLDQRFKDLETQCVKIDREFCSHGDTDRTERPDGARECFKNESCRIVRLWNASRAFGGKKVLVDCVEDSNRTTPAPTFSSTNPTTPGTNGMSVWVASCILLIVSILIGVLVFFWSRKKKKDKYQSTDEYHVQLGSKLTGILSYLRKEDNFSPGRISSLDDGIESITHQPLGRSAFDALSTKNALDYSNACKAIGGHSGLDRDWKVIAQEDLKYQKEEIQSVADAKTGLMTSFDTFGIDFLLRRPKTIAKKAVQYLRNAVINRWDIDDQGDIIQLLDNVVKDLSGDQGLENGTLSNGQCNSFPRSNEVYESTV